MPDPDLALLESNVRAAGDIARKYYGGDYKKWSKSGGSPVTEADLAVDQYLKTNLLSARPSYGWLSEESVDNAERLKTTHTFIVDPIDGTVAFLKQRPHFTICAAIVTNGRPTSAVVYNPILDECFTAQENEAALLNNQPIHVSDRSSIEDISMLGPKTSFDAKWPTMRITSLSSIAYRIAMVAAGKYDAMVSLSVKRDWDLAAADLIIHQAGGLLTDASGKKLIYNLPAASQRSTIAAGPQLHGLLLSHLEKIT